MSYWNDASAVQPLSLRKLERPETGRETRRELYETLCEALVYAASLAVLATGVAIVHHLSTHVSMIV